MRSSLWDGFKNDYTSKIKLFWRMVSKWNLPGDSIKVKPPCSVVSNVKPSWRWFEMQNPPCWVVSKMKLSLQGGFKYETLPKGWLHKWSESEILPGRWFQKWNPPGGGTPPCGLGTPICRGVLAHRDMLLLPMLSRCPSPRYIEEYFDTAIRVLYLPP